jgi:apolipoprotein N-acyltransferase
LKLHSPLPTLLPATIALTSGLIMGLTPAPFELWGLAWIAIAPLWLLLFVNPNSEATFGKRVWTAAGLGGLWGVGYNGLTLSWIVDLHPLTWMGVPWLGSVAIALFAWGFVTFWGALMIALWASGMVVLDWRSPAQNLLNAALLRVLTGTALWCGLETLYSDGALAWTPLSFTQSPHNLAILHVGRLSGATLVSAAIVVCNGLIAEAWLARTERQFRSSQVLGLLLVAIAAGTHLTGGWLLNQPLQSSPETSLRVGIIQGNISTRIKLFEEGVRQAIAAYTNGYRTLTDQGVDAVLTPEGTFPWIWVDRANQASNPLYQAILDRGVPAWVGTVGVEQNQITQSLFAFSGAGDVVGRYDKVKLVPLGEYIPFAAVLGKVISRLSPVEASMVPGDLQQQLQTPFGQAIAAICYDSAFSKVFREQARSGGEFILTASNNDPYGRTMMLQHHAQDVMRAIETDRWAVRATNTGLSGFVDPHGKTLWQSQFRTYQTHAETIHRRRTQTLYVRWGDWVTPLLLGGMAIAHVVRWRKARSMS